MAPISVPIITDKATSSKIRPTTAKIKVEVDLTKTMVTEIQIKVKGEDGKYESITQRVEY